VVYATFLLVYPFKATGSKRWWKVNYTIPRQTDETRLYFETLAAKAELTEAEKVRVQQALTEGNGRAPSPRLFDRAVADLAMSRYWHLVTAALLAGDVFMRTSSRKISFRLTQKGLAALPGLIIERQFRSPSA
jgi:hypothetical protein